MRLRLDAPPAGILTGLASSLTCFGPRLCLGLGNLDLSPQPTRPRSLLVHSDIPFPFNIHEGIFFSVIDSFSQDRAFLRHY